MRSLRPLGWLYLASLHALVIVAAVVPNASERAEGFWCADPSRKERYQGMNEAITVACGEMPDQAVMFLGDSRLRDMPMHQTAAAPTANYSIGGDTTRGLLTRMVAYPCLSRARHFVVGTGINDLSHFSNDVVIDDFRKALSFLSTVGPRITVLAIHPIDERIYRQANATLVTGEWLTNARIRAVNERLRRLLDEFAGSDYVDASAALVGEDGNLTTGFSTDGYHLNGAGRRAWVTALRPQLAGL